MERVSRFVDLFSGCGGFALGAHEAGFRPSFAFDVDPILTSSYQVNFPHTQVFRSDILELTGSRIVDMIGSARVECVFGGPPCQAFSDIGKRDPTDPRRSLLPKFFEIVSALRPLFFVMENVRGLAYADVRHVLDTSLQQVREDYSILGPVILNAADFGAATNRRRLFVIGICKDFSGGLSTADLDRFRRRPATVDDAIRDLSPACYEGERNGFDVWTLKSKARSNYAKKLRNGSTVTGLRKTIHRGETIQRFSTVLPGEVDNVGRHSRLAWGAQCPTLRAGTGNDRGSYQSVRPLHPEENRVITVREGARLQGFPDSFVFHPTIWHSFRMIGNSVCPIMSAAIFKAVAKLCPFGVSATSAA